MTKHITRMTIEDAEHFTSEERQAIIDAYPEHGREARTKGIPSLGSGRVFPISEDSILVDAFTIPKPWFQIVGLLLLHIGERSKVIDKSRAPSQPGGRDLRPPDVLSTCEMP
jgi:Terminase large subunit, T4likevirus-type, N-terminal